MWPKKLLSFVPFTFGVHGSFRSPFLFIMTKSVIYRERMKIMRRNYELLHHKTMQRTSYGHSSEKYIHLNHQPYKYSYTKTYLVKFYGDFLFIIRIYCGYRCWFKVKNFTIYDFLLFFILTSQIPRYKTKINKNIMNERIEWMTT